MLQPMVTCISLNTNRKKCLPARLPVKTVRESRLQEEHLSTAHQGQKHARFSLCLCGFGPPFGLLLFRPGAEPARNAEEGRRHGREVPRLLL
jgi:hypothetical protein